jgi:hypothetical protein
MNLKMVRGLLAGVSLGAFGCAVSTGAEEPLGTVDQGLEEGGECLVTEAILAEYCEHSAEGPFVSVSAVADPGSTTPPDISPPHTDYAISLPGGGGSFQGAVGYAPGANGQYAISHTPGVALSVLDSSGNPVPLLRSGAAEPDPCGLLDQISVFELSSTESYFIVLGPTPNSSTHVIIEFIGDGSCEECELIDLVASRSLNPPSHANGEASLDHPIGFDIPSEIPVVAGNVSSGTALFSFGTGGPLTHCLYWGTPSLNVFEHLFCTGGFDAGEHAEGSEFELKVGPLAALRGPVTAELLIESEACHDHEEEE